MNEEVKRKKRKRKNKRWVGNVDCHGPLPALFLSYMMLKVRRKTKTKQVQI